MSESLTICSIGVSEGETSSHSDYEKVRADSPSKVNKINLRTKKNLRMKRRPTGVFTFNQLNPSSSVSETSDCDDDEYIASVQSNTLYNETCFDFTTTEASTVETTSRQEDEEEEEEEDGQGETDRHTGDDLDDEDEGEGYESEVESTVEEKNMRLQNQLRLKELYIKQLEDRLRTLEMKQSTRSKHNLCTECSTLLTQRYD